LLLPAVRVQGGATHFDHLGVSIQPRQGMALLFFPAYASGTPDARWGMRLRSRPAGYAAACCHKL